MTTLDTLTLDTFQDWQPQGDAAPTCHLCTRTLTVGGLRREWLQDRACGQPVCLACHTARRQAHVYRSSAMVAQALDKTEETVLTGAALGTALGWLLAGPIGALTGLAGGTVAAWLLSKR